MSDIKTSEASSDINFDDFFSAAEQHDLYWISKAKYRFTEEMLRELNTSGLSKAQFANKMSVNPAFISRLCSGANNFTMSTMVKVAQALDCDLFTHLVPKGKSIQWIDILDEEPTYSNDWKVNNPSFHTVVSGSCETIICGGQVECQR